MEIKNRRKDEFDVLGDSGVSYIVTFTSCTCPVYAYRRKTCKHIQFVLSQLSNISGLKDKILDVIKLEGEISFIKLEKMFGKKVYESLDSLEQQAEIYHDKIHDTYRLFE